LSAYLSFKRNPPMSQWIQHVSDYHRISTKGGTYFFTLVTYRRLPIFHEIKNIELLRRCFQSTMSSHPFRIDAIVILPDHLHTVWTLPENESDYSTRWRLIKSQFSHNCDYAKLEDFEYSRLRKKEKSIWQRRFWEHLIRDEEDFIRHCDYIHFNPVKHGLVSSPIEWKYSSLSRFIEKGLYPENWGCNVDKELLKMELE
jgi:putative transposase